MVVLEAALCDELLVLSRAIHADPELAYHEERAAGRIAECVERHGIRVERGTGGLATALRARIGPPDGPSIALLAEYDALRGLGHGCGHNLIAISTVGAFLIAAGQAEGLPVAIELIGTPAEEDGGGKIDLLEAGVFRQVIAALSSHPAAQAGWTVGSTGLGIVGKRVVFRGLASHAGSAPERGRNALNGAIRLFTGVDGWRQHLPANARVHGIITDGGQAMNVVPERAEAIFGIRAQDNVVLEQMVVRFGEIARGAALQTETEVEIYEHLRLFAPVVAHPVLGDLLARALGSRGVRPARGTLVTASTDLGNVSQRLPTDWIRFPVTETPIAGHSETMLRACVTDLAHANAWVTAEALAEAALAVATDAGVRERLRG